MSANESAQSNQSPGSGYDRDAIIASIKRYYQLLSKMVAIKPQHISYAPAEGRNDEVIPLEKLRRLGFTDRMLDFVRHVPYVTSGDRPVFPGTQTINYYSNIFDYDEEEYELDDPHMVEMWPLPEERIPEGILPLSRPLQGDPSGTWWLLDTNNGELTAHSAFITRPPDEVPEDEEWRTARPVPATTYFDGLYEDLKSLNLLPVPFNPGLLVWEIWPAHGLRDFQQWADEAKEIYTKCHWPDLQRFQRAKCRKLLMDLQERCRAWEKEKQTGRPPPAAYTDAAGNPIAPPNA